MQSKRLSATIIVLLALCDASEAQVRSQEKASSKTFSSPAARAGPQAAGARLVRPDDSAAGARSTAARVRPDAVTIGREQSRDQVFRQHRLSQDRVTVDSVRRMNPSVDLDRLDKHAGQPLYLPKVAESPRRDGAAVLQMRDPNFARVQLSQDRKDLAVLQKKTSVRKEALFESPQVATRHETVLKNATLASQRLEPFTAVMSPRDVALLNAQFGTVQRIADPAVVMSTLGKPDGASPKDAGGARPGRPPAPVRGETDGASPKDAFRTLTADRVTSLESSAQPLQSVLRVTSRPGVSYEDLRREVKVVVTGADPTKPPRAWRVYVLPAAMVDRPDDYPDDTLLSLLRGLTFTTLTTPASERFLFSDLAVWLGPEDAYAIVLTDLRARRIKSRPVAIRDTSPPVIEVKFIES